MTTRIQPGGRAMPTPLPPAAIPSAVTDTHDLHGEADHHKIPAVNMAWRQPTQSGRGICQCPILGQAQCAWRRFAQPSK